jgi:hypothetical protein
MAQLAPCGLMQLKCNVDHSLPFIAEAKNEWSYTSNPPTHHRVNTDNFTCAFSGLIQPIRLEANSPSTCQYISLLLQTSDVQ